MDDSKEDFLVTGRCVVTTVGRDLCSGEKSSKDASKASIQPAHFMGAELLPCGLTPDRMLHEAEVVFHPSGSTHKLWPRPEFCNNEPLNELMRGGLAQGRGDPEIVLIRCL